MAVALGPHLQQARALVHQEQVGLKDFGLKEHGATKEDKQVERNSKPRRKLSTTLPKTQEEGAGVRGNTTPCVGSVTIAPTHTATATFLPDTSFPPPSSPPPLPK